MGGRVAETLNDVHMKGEGSDSGGRMWPEEEVSSMWTSTQKIKAR